MAKKEEYTLVCAIDFGTTFSGFSFARKNDPEKIYVKTDWGNVTGATKTPTSLLIIPGEEPKIGYEAIEAYYGLSEKEQQKSRYFDRFKMRLYESGDTLSETTMITDHSEKPMAALDVFGKVLAKLKAECLEHVNKQSLPEIDEERIKWVVTVPAIWTDTAKDFMKKAAFKGRLVKKDSNMLKIALEPEAASVCCRKLPIGEFDSSKAPVMEPGTQYMVIDAGGGTLDITVHEILENGKLAEIYFASGGSIGGAQVDQAFLTLIDDIFEKPFMKDLKKKTPAVCVEFLSNFEKSKRDFTADKKTFNVKIDIGMAEYYFDVYKKQLKESIKKDKGVSWNAGMLTIPPEIMKKRVFEPTVSAIVAHVRELLKEKELRDVKVLLMVGGLSCLKILQDEMKKEFEPKYKIVIPDDARSVVVRGAAQFGLQESTIRSRISRMTYGVQVNETYDEHKHKGKNCVVIGGVKKVPNVFSLFVQSGSKIDASSCVKKTYYPPTEDAQTVDVNFFATKETTASYTTDKGMKQIGKMTLEIPGKGKDREIEVSMKFGGTCIEVEGKDTRTKKAVKTSLDFLTTER